MHTLRLVVGTAHLLDIGEFEKLREHKDAVRGGGVLDELRCCCALDRLCDEQKRFKLGYKDVHDRLLRNHSLVWRPVVHVCRCLVPAAMQFSPQESGSDFASVVAVDLVQTPWQKIDHGCCLTRLHRFWGRSMAIEEQEWGKSMGESLDDDVIPGCYLLDLGDDFSKIWIRADYVRIYDFVEAYYKTNPAPSHRAPAVVITGHPGVGEFRERLLERRLTVQTGKSIWVYYALRRRLAERKPVILYYEHKCFLFVDEGVYEQPLDFESRHFKTFVWTLVDTDESQKGVPPILVTHGTHHYVIYITPPHKERWSRLHKTARCITVIMNPWTREEILRV